MKATYSRDGWFWNSGRLLASNVWWSGRLLRWLMIQALAATAAPADNARTKMPTPVSRGVHAVCFGACGGSKTIQCLVAMAVVGVATLCSPGASGGTILFDNLTAGSPNGDTSVTNEQWVAQAFSTSPTAYTISDVTLNMFNQNGTTGSYELQIWTATGASGSPGSQVGSAIFTGLAENLGSGPLTANGLSVTLDPSTSYFLVARGVSLTDIPRPDREPRPGSLAWSQTDVNTTAEFATVDGVIWTGPSPQNFYIKVEAAAAAVPEIDPTGIGSVLALVTGALGLVERRRLKVVGRLTLVADRDTSPI